MSYKSKEKLVKFYHACKVKSDIKCIKRILDSEGDINYQIVDSDCANSDFLGYTALHFAVKCRSNVAVIRLLMERSADFTIKDHTGSTALHLAMSFQNEYEKSFQKLLVVAFFKLENTENLKTQFESSNEFDISDAILTAHIAYKNFENPSDNNGVSHFHLACIADNSRVVEFFLRHGVSAEQRINEDSPYYAGYTPLHLAVQFYNLDVFQLLLQHGASEHVKNTFGLSALHMLLEQRTSDADMTVERFTKFEVIKKMMDVLLEKDEDANSVDDTGLSRLHIICAMSGELTEYFFLKYKNGIDHSVGRNARLWSGYTALHFASYSDELAVGLLPRPLSEVAKLLLRKGANFFVQDSKGTTPLELLLRKYKFVEIFDELAKSKIMDNILMSDGKTKLIDSIGLLVNDVTSLKKILEKDIRYAYLFVPFNSQCWPGYTNLHLAVFFRNNIKINPEEEIGGSGKNGKRFFYDVIVALLNSGADVTRQDVKGITPLSLAFRCEDEELVDLLLQHHWQSWNSIDFENLSHLHIACAAGNELVVKRLLRARIDVNIPVFRSSNWFVKKEHCNNQSHISKNCVFSIPANSTSLHASVGRGNCKIVEMLMMHNANICARDVNGMTPIHRLLPSCNPHEVGKVLFSSTVLADSIVGNTGFSHLHVASFIGDVGAVEKLLDRGADVNAFVTYDVADLKYDDASEMKLHQSGGDLSLLPLSFLSKCNSFTPLDFAGPGLSFDMAQLLLRRGANLSKITVEQQLMHHIKFVKFSIFDLIESLVLQGQMKLEQGITMLHIACYKMNFEMVNCLLKSKWDVNARVSDDSRLWPGFMPLHILIEKCKHLSETGEYENMMQLLLENGADVTVPNAQGDTPLLMNKTYRSPTAILLLKYHRNFEINPMNENGMSHFHVACLARECAIVKEFLKCGVNIDRPIDFFADKMPGCTPLHLALPEFHWSETRSCLEKRFLHGIICATRRVAVEEVEVGKALVQYGANVNAKDAHGNTPLHYAAKNLEFRRIIYNLASADFNVQNVFGQTPFEIFLSSDDLTAEDVQYFIDGGFEFNLFNNLTEKGYIGMICCKRYGSADEILKLLANNPNSVNIDVVNRTPIHNMATSCCLKDSQLQIFLMQGYDVDHQDVRGRTALNVATEFLCKTAVAALLETGADINMTDTLVNPAFGYISHFPTMDRTKQSEVLSLIAFHAKKLCFAGLFLSDLNRQILVMIRDRFNDDRFTMFREQFNRTKYVKIDSDSLSLYDFLSETGAVAAYPHMIHSKRLAVDEFFQSFDFTPFSEVKCLFRLQYRKALARCQLMEQARASLMKLLGVALDEICVITIFRYLSNEDLKNLFVSSA